MTNKFKLVLRRLQIKSLGLYSYINYRFNRTSQRRRSNKLGLSFKKESPTKKASSNFELEVNSNSKFVHYIRYLRNWRKAAYTSTVLLSLLILAILCPISFSSNTPAEAATGTAQDSSITLTFTSDTASVSLNVTDTAGSTATSSTTQDNDERAKFTITTNNVSGYELKIKASNNTSLSNGTDTIPAIGTAGIALSSFASNTWGYLPNYYNSTANTNNLYYPITTADVTLDKTTTANVSNAKEYTIGLGLRADYTKSAGIYTNSAAGSSIVLSYVANPVSYTINYDKGNATGTVDNLPAAQGSTTTETNVTLSSTVPTWTGYDFKGWCFGTLTDLNSCSGTVYNPNGAGTNLSFGIDKTTTNTVTLHAMWQKVQYTISYNANSGSGSIASQTVDGGSSVTLKDNGFTRTDHYFMGWSTSSTATSPAYRTNQSITPAGNMTLYAVWGSSTNTRLYNAVASLTRGNQTNDTNATTGIKTKPTKATSGVYTYNASAFGASSDASNDNPIYYYRGILDATTGTYGSDGDSMDYPNYVKLGITCWRIVRTTGSGGVKMVYNGMYGNTTSGSCANATTAAQIRATSATTATSTATFTSTFAGTSTAQYRSIVGVGYTRNNTYASTSATTATAYSTLFGTNSSYSDNSTNSTIKGNIETWFTNNLNSYASKLEASAGYCNDRSIRTSSSSTTLIDNSTTIVPYGTSSMTVYYFGAYTRNSNSAQSPTLNCPRSTVDLYTTSSASNGNKQLSKPVALLTADEMSFAGSGRSTASQGSGYSANSYLRSGSLFWLLSPNTRVSNGYAYGFLLYSYGDLDSLGVSNTYGVRPAISLLPGTKIASGSGTATSPWEVIPPTTVTVSNTNTTSSVDSLSIPYGESATVIVTPASGYYLSSVSCPSGYTCTGYSTGESYTSAQTVTITNNNTTSDATLTFIGEVKVTTFDQAYAAAGKSKNSGYYVMQDMSGSICSSVTDGQAGTLRDTRNGGTNYTVAKIGSICWMTKNLDLAGGTTLEHTLTNVPQGYSTSTAGFINGNTLPASSKPGSDNASAYVYNTGRTSCSSPGCYSYYSWRAATAGYNATSDGTSVSYDICPAGWRLPTLTEFNSLKSSYSSGPKLIDAPFLGFYNGYYWGSIAQQMNSYGFYWSSTASSSSAAYGLRFDTGGGVDTNGYSRIISAGIRCVAKS